jgi:hypothetical protein
VRSSASDAAHRVSARCTAFSPAWTSAASRLPYGPGSSRKLEAPITFEPVAIDGKAVRGAKEQHLPGAYLLSAFASRRGAVLAQLAIGERENELTQALPLLRQIDLNDVVVTGDALFAQRALCRHIVEQGGQYLFEVKDNQPTLLQAMQHSFRDGAPGAGGRAND